MLNLFGRAFFIYRVILFVRTLFAGSKVYPGLEALVMRSVNVPLPERVVK